MYRRGQRGQDGLPGRKGQRGDTGNRGMPGDDGGKFVCGNFRHSLALLYLLYDYMSV